MIDADPRADTLVSIVEWEHVTVALCMEGGVGEEAGRRGGGGRVL